MIRFGVIKDIDIVCCLVSKNYIYAMIFGKRYDSFI